MKRINVTDNELKEITEFLLDKKVIFHPDISPDGIMDFTEHYNREYVLLLDRNILTKMVELFRKGTLGDSYILKIIGSLLFWAEINNVSVNSGIALNEYAVFKDDNSFASEENNIFLDVLNSYSPKVWLDIGLQRIKEIPVQKIFSNKKYKFNIENDHYLMHYAEMLCISRLFIDNKLSVKEKVVSFFEWNSRNLLFCQYTIVYVLLLFSNQIHTYKKVDISDIGGILKKCKNQAWDLTYLSFWSTLYWDDYDKDTVYLFATLDKDLKRIFSETHLYGNKLFIKYYGEKAGKTLSEVFNRLTINRIKPKIDSSIIKNLVDSEETLLYKQLG